MRINTNAADRIIAALAAVNGKAERHAYTLAGEVQAVAREAESQLEALGIPKAARAGATYWSQSGSTLPNAYKYRATTTTVELKRGAGGWFLVSAHRSELQPGQRPRARLYLTPQQDAIAVAKVRAHYSVPRPVEMVSL